MSKTSVYWTKDERLSLDMPDHWQVLGCYNPQDPSPVADVSAEVVRTLESPLGRANLLSLAGKARRIALVIDDLARPTPAEQLLCPAVRILERAGRSDGEIIGVVANGLHPPLEPDELVAKVGREFAGRFKWIQNDCRNAERYTFLGTIGAGSGAGCGDNHSLDVHVLREIAQADLVILFGSVSPHVQAGFGGGNKLLFPGCAHVGTIGPLHKLGLDGWSEKLIGQRAAENPMRRAVEKAGRLLGERVFFVGSLLDSLGRITVVSSGDPLQVHQCLADGCAGDCGLEVADQADVVIVSAYPRDYDLLQGFKCVVNTRLAARDGGILIGMLNLTQVGHLKMRSRLGPIPTVGQIRLLTRLLGPEGLTKLIKQVIRGLDEEAEFFLRLALETVSRHRVLAYCPELIRSGKRFPCVEAFDEMPAIWDRAEKLLGRPERVRVNVFTQGGTSYPVLRKPGVPQAER